MAGRPAKPLSLIKKHLTKDEINARQEMEKKVKSGVKNFKANEQVMQNPVALAMFKKLKKLYKNIDYIEGLDENIINRYCLLTAEAQALEQLVNNMNDDVNNCEDFEDRIALYKAISGTLSSLNKIRDMLLKIEDRLLLNPTARIKNVPKKEKQQKEDPNESLFGD